MSKTKIQIAVSFCGQPFDYQNGHLIPLTECCSARPYWRNVIRKGGGYRMAQCRKCRRRVPNYLMLGKTDTDIVLAMRGCPCPGSCANETSWDAEDRYDAPEDDGPFDEVLAQILGVNVEDLV